MWNFPGIKAKKQSSKPVKITPQFIELIYFDIIDEFLSEFLSQLAQRTYDDIVDARIIIDTDRIANNYISFAITREISEFVGELYEQTLEINTVSDQC